MPHCLILGMTESGKTTLAKRLAAKYKADGYKVIVLDSMCDPGWQADYQTSDPDEFLATFWASQSCMCFIDEAGDSVGRYDKVMQRTATRGRHWGHSVHYISQRGVQIATTVRDQCSHIFLLTTSAADSKIHANEWNAPIILRANALRKGQYFHATRFGAVECGALFGESPDGTDTHTDRTEGPASEPNTRAEPTEADPNRDPGSGPGADCAANVGERGPNSAEPAASRSNAGRPAARRSGAVKK